MHRYRFRICASGQHFCILSVIVHLNEEERKECEESYGCTDIDLGYVLPGSISAFFQ